MRRADRRLLRLAKGLRPIFDGLGMVLAAAEAGDLALVRRRAIAALAAGRNLCELYAEMEEDPYWARRTTFGETVRKHRKAA